MKILLLGSGAREHALAVALKASPSTSELFCIPGNPGIAEIAICHSIEVTNDSIVAFCKEQSIEFVVVGPEQYLEHGIADTLQANSISVFGPSKSAANLETSKSFSKDFMKRHSIPTARYGNFSQNQLTDALDFLHSLSTPIVIKADGLAAGKGVVIAESMKEAQETVGEMFSGKFGTASSKIVIEEFLNGEEISVLAICDGNDFFLLPAAQDHKRILENDKGKNTGGMGSYAPTPFATNDVMNSIASNIVAPTLLGMKQEGSPFVGCLFVGLMIVDGKPFVIEYNVRFGDPETQSVLTLLKGDVASLLYSASIGSVDKQSVMVSSGYASTVVLASKGYPDSFEKGKNIDGLTTIKPENVQIYHAGTTLKDGAVVTNGGRVISVTAYAPTLEESIEKAYQGVNTIQFENKVFRQDIGMKGMKQLKLNSH
jgi:phosphoribosylamine--glycine ligase